MFIAIARYGEWEVYRKGNSKRIAIFASLANVKKTVERMGGELTVVIAGYDKDLDN